jgi:hypothetical protein
MKLKSNTSKQQKGFFDLGLSVLILTISGAITLSVNHAQDEKIAQQKDEVNIAVGRQSATTEVAVIETGNLRDDIQ